MATRRPRTTAEAVGVTIGKALGTIAAKTGLAHPAAQPKKRKERLPRKLKKTRKKQATLAAGQDSTAS